MALFTDTGVVTLDDLQLFESSIVSVASSHGINVDTKITLAMNSIGDRLMQWLLAVGASDPQWMVRRSIGLSTVVVTPSLRRWITFDSLTRLFAEAYNVQLNTRFQGKWNEYQAESRNAAQMMFVSGIGLVYSPLPKPAMPLISVQDGSLPLQAVFVGTSWVDQHGHESAMSPVNGQVLSGAAGVAVSTAEGAVHAPAAAAGWNVYVSSSQNGMTRQNTAPLPVGTTWQIPTTGLIQGAAADCGQAPEFFVTLSRQILRG